MKSSQNITLTQRALLTKAKRIVVKVGTRVLVDQHGKPCRRRIASIVRELAVLKRSGREVILVSSGAIGAGMAALNMHRTANTTLPDLQMAAAVGQTRLLQFYNKYFARKRCQISQVLLTHADLKNRERHLNARNTIINLLQHHVIPIVNENDVVAVDEIKVGDNDILSALVSVLIDADLLIILTTPDGLQKPNVDEKIERVDYLKSIDNAAFKLASGKTDALSTGGMTTKLKAAQIANRTGAFAVIASGLQKKVIKHIIKGHDVGTLIGSKKSADRLLGARKRWIAFFHRPQGTLFIDDGAVKALRERGRSLLPVGITQVEGSFPLGALVNIVSDKGLAIGHGLVDYNSEQIEKIKGQHTSKITAVLGTKDFDEVIRRENMAIYRDDG